MNPARMRRLLALCVVAAGVLVLLTYGPPLLVQFLTFVHAIGVRGQAMLLVWVLTFIWVRRGVASATRDRSRVCAVEAPEHLHATGALMRLEAMGDDVVPWLEADVVPMERRARHEAAHVVGGRAMGGVLQRADVAYDPVAGRGGQVIMLWPSAMSLNERSWGMAVLAVSANELDIAEGCWDGSSVVDLQTAQTAAFMIVSSGQPPRGYVGPLTVESLLAAAREQARDILRKATVEIDRIAGMLERLGDQGHLTEADVRGSDLLM